MSRRRASLSLGLLSAMVLLWGGLPSPEAHSHPEPVEIVLARGVARIDGRVTDGAGTPVAGAEVVLVPEPPLSENLMLFANATSREDGRFSAARLAPGRYRAYAFSFDPATAQMNAAWLLAYVRFGVPVAVEPSSTSSVELRLVPEALGR